MTSDDRISAFFGDRLARSLFESLTNRNDFGARRLQFSASGRDIERVSARTNDHDHSVSCDERWIFFDNTKPRSFWHVMTYTSKCRDLFSGLSLPVDQAVDFPLGTTARQTDYPLNGRTVRGYCLGLSFVGSLEPSCFDHAPQCHQIL